MWFQANLKQWYQCVKDGNPLDLCNRGMSWDTYWLSFICLSISNLQSPLSLQMTASVYVKSDLLMTLKSYKLISIDASHHNCSLHSSPLLGKRYKDIMQYIASMKSPSNAYCNTKTLGWYLRVTITGWFTTYRFL